MSLETPENKVLDSGVNSESTQDASTPGDMADVAITSPAVDEILIEVQCPGLATNPRMKVGPMDMVAELRTFLGSFSGVSDMTSYHLEHEGQVLNIARPIGSYPELASPSANGEPKLVVVVPDMYTQRTTMEHIARFKEILSHPPVTTKPEVVYAGILVPEEGGVAKVKTSSTSTSTSTSTSNKKAGKDQQQDGKNKSGGKNTGGKKGEQTESKSASAGSTSTTSTSTSTSSEESHRPVSLSKVAPVQATIPICIRNIASSVWNPVPPARQLLGDLYYLEVLSLEGTVLHITAAVDGFFLNRSTHDAFNPYPASPHHKSFTLVELLKRASPRFATAFHDLMTNSPYEHPLESLEEALVPVDWLVAEDNVSTKPAKHATTTTVSPTTSESAAARARESLATDLSAWNDYYQSYRECSRSTPEERMHRDRSCVKTYVDFIEAAKTHAIAIVEGTIAPMNPTEPRRQHVYLRDGIFYSFAVDVKGAFSRSGSVEVDGDDIYSTSMLLDVDGIDLVGKADLPGLATVMTAVFDYKGFRLVAQSAIPGIFQARKATKHTYGAMDHGFPFTKADEATEKRLVELARQLHIQPRKVIPIGDVALVEIENIAAEAVEAAIAEAGEGDESKIDEKSLMAIAEEAISQALEPVELHLSAETKGMMGSDSRNYLLDLARLTPRDVNYPDPVRHAAYVHRPELVQAYVRHEAYKHAHTLTKDMRDRRVGALNREQRAKMRESERQAIQMMRSKRTEAPSEADLAMEKEREELHAKEEKEDQAAAEEDAKLGPLPTETEEDAAMREAYLEKLDSLRFNVNLLIKGDWKFAEDEKVIAEDKAALEALSTYLTDTVIPEFVQSIMNHDIIVLDTETLVKAMHAQGIPDRYLGRVAALAEKEGVKQLVSLARRTMIAQAATYIIRTLMQEVGPRSGLTKLDYVLLGPFVAAFFSSLLGPSAFGAGFSSNELEIGLRQAEAYFAARVKAHMDLVASEAAAAAKDAAQTRAEVREARSDIVRKVIEDAMMRAKVAETVADNNTAASAAVATTAAAAASGDDDVKDASITTSKSAAKALRRRQAEQRRTGSAFALAPARTADGNKNPEEVLHPLALWSLVRYQIQKTFDWDVPATLEDVDQRGRLGILRTLCKQVGVQIRARDIDFLMSSSPSSSATAAAAAAAALAPVACNPSAAVSALSAGPILAADIVSIFPVAHYNLPHCKDSQDVFETGKSAHLQRNLPFAYLAYQEAIGLLAATYGILHGKLMELYTAFAEVCAEAGDFKVAIDAQHRALVSACRYYGADSAQAAQAHTLLAFYLLSNNMPKSALIQAERASAICDILGGPSSPDAIAVLSNRGVIFSNQKKHDKAIAVFKEVYERAKAAYGEESVPVAEARHMMAVEYTFVGDYQRAMEEEAASYTTFLAVAKDRRNPRVAESALMVSQFDIWNKGTTLYKNAPNRPESSYEAGLTTALATLKSRFAAFRPIPDTKPKTKEEIMARVAQKRVEQEFEKQRKQLEEALAVEQRQRQEQEKVFQRIRMSPEEAKSQVQALRSRGMLALPWQPMMSGQGLQGISMNEILHSVEARASTAVPALLAESDPMAKPYEAYKLGTIAHQLFPEVNFEQADAGAQAQEEGEDVAAEAEAEAEEAAAAAAAAEAEAAEAEAAEVPSEAKKTNKGQKNKKR